MVLGMTIYNMLLNEGWSDHFIMHLVKEIWLVFIIALLLDVFIVGPIAKKLVFSLAKPDTKKIFIIVGISTTMVLCMVTLMSIFGSVLSQGFTSNIINVYPSVFIHNLIVALPLNLIIVSPLVRFLFVKIFPAAAGEA